MAGRFAQIPEQLLDDSAIVPGAVRLYAVLDFTAGTKGSCFISEPTMADRLGCSERTVRNYIEALERAGYIAVSRRRFGAEGQRVSNVYSLPYRRSASGNQFPTTRQLVSTDEATGCLPTRAFPKGNEPEKKKRPFEVDSAALAAIPPGRIFLDGSPR